MISTSRLTWKLKCLQVQVGSLKLVPVPAYPPQTCCSRGMKSSWPLPKQRRCLFIPNCLMVLSNALFSHHPTFSSFLRDLPAVSIYEDGNFQYMRVQRLHVLLQAVSGHRESRLETGTPSAGPQAGRMGTGRTCQHLRCHSVFPTQPPKDWQMRDSWEEQDSAHGQTGKTNWLDSDLNREGSTGIPFLLIILILSCCRWTPGFDTRSFLHVFSVPGSVL